MASIHGGLFIVMEGIGGCGKSTQTTLLAEWLRARNYEVWQTRQPGGTPVGARIRALVLDETVRDEIGPDAQLLLFTGDRAVHRDVIRRHLDDGHAVICDRFVHSSYAYQGQQGTPLTELQALNAIATRGLEPDCVYFLDVSAEEAARRRAGDERAEVDRYDLDGLEADRQRSQIYRRLCDESGGRMIRLDGSKPTAETAQLIMADVAGILEKKES